MKPKQIYKERKEKISELFMILKLEYHIQYNLDEFTKKKGEDPFTS